MIIKFWPQNFIGKENLEKSGNLKGSSSAHNLKRCEIRFFRTQQGVFGFSKSGKYSYFDQAPMSVFPEYSDP